MSLNPTSNRAEVLAKWRKVRNEWLAADRAWFGKLETGDLPSDQEVQAYRKCMDRYAAESGRLWGDYCKLPQ